MSQILRFNDFVKEANASYAGDWPLNKQQIGMDDGDVANNQEYAKKENKFQEVQEHMKAILKPILLKKNPNANDSDIEKVSDSFFNLGDNKAQEVRKMVDNCKDAKQCAQDIVNRYLRYVKINFNSKDNVNDVEQDSVMASEGMDSNMAGVCEECDGKGYTDKGRCKACNGTGLTPGVKKKRRSTKSFKQYNG